MLCCSRMAGRKVTKKMTANVVSSKLFEEARLETKFVTPKLLDDALAATEARMDARLAATEARLREDFRTEMRQHFTALNRTMAQLRIDINTDTLRSIQSVEESYRTRTAGVDDKYRDLPEPVTALEHAVGIKRS